MKRFTSRFAFSLGEHRMVHISAPGEVPQAQPEARETEDKPMESPEDVSKAAAARTETASTATDSATAGVDKTVEAGQRFNVPQTDIEAAAAPVVNVLRTLKAPDGPGKKQEKAPERSLEQQRLQTEMKKQMDIRENQKRDNATDTFAMNRFGKVDVKGNPFLYKNGTVEIDGKQVNALLAYTPAAGLQYMREGTTEWKKADAAILAEHMLDVSNYKEKVDAQKAAIKQERGDESLATFERRISDNSAMEKFLKNQEVDASDFSKDTPYWEGLENGAVRISLEDAIKKTESAPETSTAAAADKPEETAPATPAPAAPETPKDDVASAMPDDAATPAPAEAAPDKPKDEAPKAEEKPGDKPKDETSKPTEESAKPAPAETEAAKPKDEAPKAEEKPGEKPSLKPEERAAEIKRIDERLAGIEKDLNETDPAPSPEHKERLLADKAKLEAEKKTLEGVAKVPETQMERLQQSMDEGLKKLKEAKTPGETMAALMQVLASLVEFIQRATNGTLGESLKKPAEGEKPKETTGETALGNKLDKELKDRAEKTKETDPAKNREGLKQEKTETINKNKETIKTLDGDVETNKKSKISLLDQKLGIEKKLTELGTDEKKSEEVTSLKTQLTSVEKQITAVDEAVTTIDKQRDNLEDTNKQLETEVKALEERENAGGVLEKVIGQLRDILNKKGFKFTLKLEDNGGKNVIVIEGLTVEQAKTIDPNATDTSLKIDPTNPPASVKNS